MTVNERSIIKVPASSANLGPGFDSVGIAVDLFLTLEVEPNESWEFTTSNDELKQFPTNQEHFICKVAQKVAEKFGKTLTPCKVVMESQIPLARGLGSSAAAIIAGIELADLTGNLGLSKQQKLLFATQFEGHPDNVGASLYGGLVVGCYRQGEVDMLSFSTLSFEMVAMIPNKLLLTKDSRGVLPKTFSYPDAVQASATANLLVASLLGGNFSLAGKMMERDLFHQPYRKPLIDSYREIEQAAKRLGAFGVALSGAGPTVLCYTECGKGEELASQLQSEFKSMTVQPLKIENSGSRVDKAVTVK